MVLVAVATKSRFADSGTIFAMYHDAMNLATVAAFTALFGGFGGFHTPRRCMLRSVAAVLERAADEGWDVGREMIGWGLGEWPVLLPCEDDSGTDVSDE